MSVRRREWLLMALISLMATEAAATEPPRTPPVPPASGQVPRAGRIASDGDGVEGYQHGPTRSRFSVGGKATSTSEHGWWRQTGPAGALAISLHNGVVMALPDAHAAKERGHAYPLDPVKHNKDVLKYFIAAGLPRDQIGGVHALTRLSSSGHQGETRAALPTIDGYVSVVERKVQDCVVPDSVAWARLDGRGKIVSEGVYWPAIPSKAVHDARQMKAVLAQDSEQRTKFLAGLPAGLPAGQVVIRHSSAAMQSGEFEALASYDVLEQRVSLQPNRPGGKGDDQRAITVVRHLGSDGVEVRLPQERRTVQKDYPEKKQTAGEPATPKQR